MPRMNRLGECVMGLTNGPVSIERATIASNAGSSAWLNDSTVVYQQGPPYLLMSYETATAARAQVDDRGANELRACGGRWAAWLGGVGLRTSWGLHLPAAGLLGLAPDGTLGIVADRQAGTGLALLRLDGSRLDLPGSARHMHVIDRDTAVWSDYAGKLHAAGMPTPVTAAGEHAFEVRAAMHGGEWWVAYGTHARLLVHPARAAVGVEVVSRGGAFGPDMADVRGSLIVAWSIGIGELPGELRKRRIDASVDALVDLSAAVPPVDLPPAPQPLPPAPPLWFVVMKALGRSGNEAAAALAIGYNAIFVEGWRGFVVEDQSTHRMTAPEAAAWRAQVAALPRGTPVFLGDDVLLEPRLAGDVAALWPRVMGVFVTIEQVASGLTALEQQVAVVSARASALSLAPRPLAAYLDTDDATTAFPRWPAGATWVCSRNYLARRPQTDWRISQRDVAAELAANLSHLSRIAPPAGRVLIVGRAYRGNGNAWGPPECVEVLWPLYLQAAAAYPNLVRGLVAFGFDRDPFDAIKTMPRVQAQHGFVAAAITGMPPIESPAPEPEPDPGPGPEPVPEPQPVPVPVPIPPPAPEPMPGGGGHMVVKSVDAVSFRTFDGVHFLRARDGGGPQGQEAPHFPGSPYGLVDAEATAPGPHELFDVVRLDDEHVALRSVNGFFACAEDAGRADAIVANRAEAHAWERFRLVPSDYGGVGLQAVVNGCFVAAEERGGGRVTVNRKYDKPGPWESFTPSAALFEEQAPGQPPGPQPTPPPPSGAPKVWPTGAIRLATETQLADDAGARPFMGYTDFQSPNNFRDDRPFFEARAAFMSSIGYDFDRSLGTVAWTGLEIDPRRPDYWDVIVGSTVRKHELGLRTQWTIGADLGHPMFDWLRAPGELDRFYREFATRLRPYRHMLMPPEMVNEFSANVNWPFSVADMRRVAGIVRGILGMPVKLSAPRSDVPAHVAEMGASRGDVLPFHLDRSNTTFEGDYRIPRQARGPQMERPGGVAWDNNEPAGPESTGPDLTDREVLLAIHVSAFMCDAVSSTYHARAGTGNRGKRDISQSPGVREAASAKRLLPADIGAFTFRNHTDALNPVQFTAVGDEMDKRSDRKGVVRGFSKVHPDGRFVVQALGVSLENQSRPGMRGKFSKAGTDVTMRRAARLQVVRAIDAAVLREMDVRQGQTFWLEPGPQYLLVGR